MAQGAAEAPRTTDRRSARGATMVIGIATGIVVGAVGGLLALRFQAGSGLAMARRARQLMLAEARREADALRREAQLEGKEEAVRVRAEIEGELQARRAEAIQAGERLRSREDELDRRLGELERREQGIADREVHVKELQEELKAARERELDELERLSGLTIGEAKAEMLTRSEELVRHDLARRAGQLEEEAQTE